MVYDKIPIPWNVHRIHPDRLPVITVSKKHSWFSPSISLMMSDYERAFINGTRKPAQSGSEALAELKEQIYAIFLGFTGIEDNEPCSIFTMIEPSASLPYAILFLSNLRLDLASHTCVLDGHILCPTSDRLEIRSALTSIQGLRINELKTPDRKALLWKRLLPALAERCRQTWTHREDCQYARADSESFPSSTERTRSPICRCGEGKDTDSMRDVKGWDKLAPFCTRVAISPLYAVSYMESVAGLMKDLGSAFSPSADEEKDSPFGDVAALNIPSIRRAAEEWVRSHPNAEELFNAEPGQLDGENIEELRDQSLKLFQQHLQSSGPVSAQEVGCKKCGASGDLKVCGQCKQASYCSEACQRQDWKKHKQHCRRA